MTCDSVSGVTWCGFDFGGGGWVMFSFVSATGSLPEGLFFWWVAGAGFPDDCPAVVVGWLLWVCGLLSQ
ncbi:hypothetical protein CEP80_05965 [Jonesia denitrificans]|nr:hypothetical protein CEP80_05965 [Jonesia denitrificans]